MIDKETIKLYINESKLEDSLSIHSINKHAFSAMLSGLILKCLKSESPEAEEQLASLYRMERVLEQLTFRNCITIFQSKMIVAYERELAIVEQEKSSLIKENLMLKKNIK